MKYYMVDAFAAERFTGNQAGVCIVEEPLCAEQMQKIAAENNLAETAFLEKRADGYHLRWFTPLTEIDLCGHATLGAAFVLMNFLEPDRREASFATMSGTLRVERRGEIYVMDFPSRMPKPFAAPDALSEILGASVVETHLSRDLLVVLENEEAVGTLTPDMERLARLTKEFAFGIIVTARGERCDFVSRFFAPNAGIPEDPVTGSSHTELIPFWRERLRKTSMTARQLSQRGGTLYCEDRGDRVRIGGTAVCYLKGEIEL